MPSYLCHFVTGELGLGQTPFVARYGWAEMWVAFCFAARVLLSVASSQENCLWLPLGVALNLGKVVFLAPSLRTLLGSMGFLSTAWTIYYCPS